VTAQLAEEDARAALEERARQRALREAAPVLREAVDQQERGPAPGLASAVERGLREGEPLPVVRERRVRDLLQRSGRAAGAASGFAARLARCGLAQSQPWRR
jgi:hypothetical protein